jgi:lipopolysaccharide/colanic/teichoic acid biosynthesis glycosyltransferase
MLKSDTGSSAFAPHLASDARITKDVKLLESSDAPNVGIPNDWLETIEHRARGIRFERAFAASTLIAACALFLVYWQIVFTGVPLSEIPASNLYHMVLNVIANIGCVVIAYHARGDLHYKLSSSLLGVVLVHGSLVVAIVIFRLYYSRLMLSLALLTSIGLVTATALAFQRWFPRRIGIMPGEFRPEVWEWIPIGAKVISEEETDVSKYDLVLVDWSRVSHPHQNAFISRALLSGCVVKHVACYVEERSGRVSLDHFAPEHATRAIHSNYLTTLKQPIDILIVLLVLPIVTPVLLIAMLAIYISMGRPIFFTQQRVGWGGGTFRICKLRTMVPSRASYTVATVNADTRVTPVGRFLRRCRIDEIPQLYNVLIGDMSLVGPRPEQPSLVERYLEEIPAFRYRQLLLPGITGWAQIRSGYAANTRETKTKLTYDLYYLKNTSLLLDCKILLDTARAIVIGKSYR